MQYKASFVLVVFLVFFFSCLFTTIGYSQTVTDNTTLIKETSISYSSKTANTSYESLETTILKDYNVIEIEWNMTLKDRHDPSICSKLEVFATQDGKTWIPWGAATTCGSDSRRNATLIPTFGTVAPPEGWKIKTILTTGEKQQDVGAIMNIKNVTVNRALSSTHNSVAFDTSCEGYGDGVSSVTTASCTISGSADAVIVTISGGWLHGGVYNAGDISNVAATGTTATNISITPDAEGRTTGIWVLTSPNTGSQTATVTIENTNDEDVTIIMSSWSGVDQTTPTADYTSATGLTTNPTITVPNTETDGYVVDVVWKHTINAVGASQTDLSSIDTRAGHSIQDGADGGVMSWTGGAGNQQHSHSGVRLIPSTGPAGATYINASVSSPTNTTYSNSTAQYNLSVVFTPDSDGTIDSYWYTLNTTANISIPGNFTVLLDPGYNNITIFMNTTDGLVNQTSTIFFTYYQTQTYSRVVTDTSSISDSDLRNYNAFRSSSDTSTLTDSYLRGFTGARIVADVTTLSDTAKRLLTRTYAVSDVYVFSDSTQTQWTARRISSDSIQFTDTSGRTLIGTRIGTDSVTLSDSAGKQYTATRLATSVVAVVDSDNREYIATRLAANSITFTDSDNREYIATRTSSDTYTLTDTSGRTFTARRILSDIVLITDSTNKIVAILRIATDHILLTDSYLRVVTDVRTSADTVNLSDTDLRSLSGTRVATNIITMTDSANRYYTTARISSDSYVMVDSTGKQYIGFRSASDVFTFTDSANRRLTAFRVATDSILITTTLLSDHQQVNVFIRIASDTVMTLDLTTRQVSFQRLGTDEYMVVDTTDRTWSGTRVAVDVMSLIDSASFQKIITRITSDSIILSDLSTRTASFFRGLSDITTLIENIFSQGGMTVTVTPGGGGGSNFENYEFYLQGESDFLSFERLDLKIIKFNVTNIDSDYGYFDPECIGTDCKYIVLQPGFGVNPNATVNTFFLVQIPLVDLRNQYSFNITAKTNANNSIHFDLNLTEGLLVAILNQDYSLADYDLVLDVTNKGRICTGDTIEYTAFLLSNNIQSQDIILKTYITTSNESQITPDETNTLYVEENNAISKALSVDTRINWDEGYYRLVGNIVNYTDPTYTFFYLKNCSQLQFNDIPILANVLDSIPVFLQRPVDIFNLKGIPFAYIFMVLGLVIAFGVWLKKFDTISASLFWFFFLWIILTGVIWYVIP